MKYYVNARWMWCLHGFLPTWHRMDHVSWVTWIIFKNHFLEVGIVQNRETMAFYTVAAVGLFCFIVCEDPREWKFIVRAFGWGPGHVWLHTTFEGPWPHYMTLEVCWDALWTLFFGLSEFHGHGSWLVCEEVVTKGHFKHEIEDMLHSKISHWSKRLRPSKYFTLESEGLRTQRNFPGWKAIMDASMACYKLWFMIS